MRRLNRAADTDEICRRFEKAIRDFLKKKMQLLGLDINERELGGVLAHLYVRLLFPDHNVDAEYNRVGFDGDPKRLKLPPECHGGHVRRVLPDLVVHRRGDNDENLLVAELKMETSTQPRRCDLTRLKAFRQQLHYHVGVFVELPAGKGARDRELQIQWFK
jgi:hypothetical protein